MNKKEIETLKQAIVLLGSLVGEPSQCESVLLAGPVARFAREYLAAVPGSGLTTYAAWVFYTEISQANELPKLRKAVFLRELPGVMEAVYNVRKSHNVEYFGRRLRGFRGIGLRSELQSP